MLNSVASRRIQETEKSGPWTTGINITTAKEVLSSFFSQEVT